METKKIILYVIIGVILLLLIFSSFGMLRFNNGRGSGGSGGSVVNSNMPEECRKPEGQDLQAWKEHLGHHENTKFCLDYYK